MNRPRRKGLAAVGLGLALQLVGACAEAPDPATVSDVVAGATPTEDPERFAEGLPPGSVLIAATVTDVRGTEAVLIELSDGAQTIWVSGFPARPARGVEVLTALIGSPQPDDTLGVVYPSVGPLDPDQVQDGWTDVGALAVLVGVGAGTVLMALVIASLVRRSLSSRRCPSCSARTRNGWLTCPSCGKSLVQSPAPGTAADSSPSLTPGPLPGRTILTSGDVEPAASPAPAPPVVDHATRIVRE